MSWAEEMSRVDKLRQVLLKGQMAFDANQAWEYTIFETEAEQRVGGTGLHHSRDNPKYFEIAYWVHCRLNGRGIATTKASIPNGTAYTHLGEATQVAIPVSQTTAPAGDSTVSKFTLDHEEDHDVLAKGHLGRRLVWIRDHMS